MSVLGENGESIPPEPRRRTPAEVTQQMMHVLPAHLTWRGVLPPPASWCGYELPSGLPVVWARILPELFDGAGMRLALHDSLGGPAMPMTAHEARFAAVVLLEAADALEQAEREAASEAEFQRLRDAEKG